MVTLEITDSSNRVRKPTSPSEFEVQCWLYTRLQEIGLDVRGEVKVKFGTGREVCRFDLVIYEGDEATEIIEVKGAPISHKKGLHATRQAQRYTKFGVPVTFVYGMKDAEQFIKQRER